MFGNEGAVYSSVAGEDSPDLRTTISGLTAGDSYNVYTYYWVSGDGNPTGNNQWDISTGLTQGALTSYLWNDGTNVDGIAGHFDSAVLTTEGNRRLFEIDLGTAVADASGEIQIFVGDNPGNDDRTWYDGVGFSTVPEPSSAALLGLGGLALILRRRK